MSPNVSDPSILFNRWYAVPLTALESLPNGDGAFVAFGVSLALYERFARSAINAAGGRANDQALHARLAADFGVTEPEAAEFWQVMRHGMQHQAMPLQRQHGGSSLTPWLFHGEFPRAIQFGTQSGQRVLQVQPWLFRDVVLALYRTSPQLIAHNQSFPWASIFPMAQVAEPGAAADGGGM
jgi:hypothetical protein